MNRYKVTDGVLVVPAGTSIQLSPGQVAPRRHRLAPVAGEPDTHVAAGDLQFKAGEIVGLSEITKSQAHRLAIIDEPKARRRADASA